MSRRQRLKSAVKATACALLVLLPGLPVVGQTSAEPAASVKEYFITADPDDFAQIYANYSQDIYIPITLEHNGKTYTDVRMRIRGDSTREFQKKSLKVRFDGEAFENGRDRLNFNAEFEDNSYVHAVLTSRVMRDSGQPAFLAEHARLYLNGEYLGLYVRIENMDSDFLVGNGFDPSGDLYKATRDGAAMNVFEDVETLWEKKTNLDAGFAPLTSLISDINSVSDSEFRSFVQSNFDYDALINIFAMNILVSNVSTYYHNYYMFRDKGGSGKWMMFPWDVDKTFAHRDFIFFPYHQSTWSPRPDNPLVERALINDQMFSDIQSRMETLSSTVMTEQRLHPIIDSLKVLLEPSVAQDVTDNINSVSDWHEQLDRDKSFVSNRHGIVKTQIQTWPLPFQTMTDQTVFTGPVTLEWQPTTAPSGASVTYNVRFAPTGDITDSESVTEAKGLTVTSHTFTGVPPGKYDWQVEAVTAAGQTWAFDTISRFVVSSGDIDDGFLPPTISSNLTLSADDGYQASGDVVVAPGATLTIRPGVTIQMPDDASLIVNGGLVIQGSSSNPVRLTRLQGVNTWGGICLQNTSGTTTLDHVIVEHASEPSSTNCRGAVSAYQSDLTIRNAVFRNNRRFSVYSNSAGPLLIEDSIFERSNLEQHVRSEGGSSLRIADTEFRKLVSGGDSVELDDIASGRVEGSLFDGGDNDCLDIGGDSFIEVVDTEFYECQDNAIAVRDGVGSVSGTRIIIADSGTGIAVRSSATVDLDGITVWGNETSVELTDGAAATFANSIFASSSTHFQTGSSGPLTVSYSLIDSIDQPGTNNLRGNPGFGAPHSRVFTLLPDSPAINAGDPGSSNDPDGTRRDMGAIPFNSNQPVSFLLITEINYNSPASNNSGDWVEIFNPTGSGVSLSGWTLKDGKEEHAFNLPDANLGAGDYLVIAEDLSAFKQRYPGVSNVVGSFGSGPTNFSLSNRGEAVRLYNSSGNLADAVTYDDEAPWPTSPDGDGYTLELRSVQLDNSDSSSWKSSDDIGGSPGQENALPTLGDRDVPSLTLGIDALYPNPLQDVGTVVFQLTERSNIQFEVFTVTGQRVMDLDAGSKSPGQYVISMETKNLSSGIYFLRMMADEKSVDNARFVIVR